MKGYANLILLPKAARADFLLASIIPFFIGIAYAVSIGFALSFLMLLLGLIAVISAHLSANLLNDYYDYKSGADNQAPKASSFFGGSRAIQEGIFTHKEILRLSLLFLLAAVFCGILISIITRDLIFILLMAVAGFLAIEYTAPPLRLAYNRAGEVVIFLLFGIMTTVGGFYLLSRAFTLKIFLLALPLAFLIKCVIICNEVPDSKTDVNVKKNNLVSLVGIKKAYLLYILCILLSLASLILNIKQDILPVFAWPLCLLYILGIKAAIHLKNGTDDIKRLINASRLTIMQHSLVGLSLIIIILIT